MNPECEYYDLVYEHGKEYHCCKHTEKQDDEVDVWVECEKFCDFIEGEECQE